VVLWRLQRWIVVVFRVGRRVPPVNDGARCEKRALSLGRHGFNESRGTFPKKFGQFLMLNGWGNNIK
jgi:hypothetical protein